VAAAETLGLIPGRDDMPVWQKLNVTAFLMSGIVGSAPDIIGERYGTQSHGLVRATGHLTDGSADRLEKRAQPGA
jgi:hypothetical protein